MFFTFLVSGLWHGASWTFVIWGALHGFYLVFELLTANIKEKVANFIGLTKIPKLRNFLQILTTFSLITFAWIFFRANNIEHAISYVSEIFSYSLFSIPYFENDALALPTIILVSIFIFCYF